MGSIYRLWILVKGHFIIIIDEMFYINNYQDS